jgi:predicted ATPase
LLVENISADTDRAAASFQRAIDVAHKQNAKTWELRATVDLARLLKQTTAPQARTKLILPVYSWFTEGLQTPDLLAAKSLLDELAKQP